MTLLRRRRDPFSDPFLTVPKSFGDAYVIPPAEAPSWNAGVCAPAVTYTHPMDTGFIGKLPQPQAPGDFNVPTAGANNAVVVVFDPGSAAAPNASVKLTYTDGTTATNSARYGVFEPGAVTGMFITKATKPVKKVTYSTTGAGVTWVPLLVGAASVSSTVHNGTSGGTPNPVVSSVTNPAGSPSQWALSWHWVRPGADLNGFGTSAGPSKTTGLVPVYALDTGAAPNDYLEVQCLSVCQVPPGSVFSAHTNYIKAGNLYNYSAGCALFG